MDHQDHVNLLRDGIPAPGGLWADFGSGTGAFTLALAELIGAKGRIYSIDKDAGALRQQARVMKNRFPDVPVELLAADFTHPFDLPLLDGLVIANALHFQREKEPVLRRLASYLKPGGRFLLVEYNTDRGNMWVPHPISFENWKSLARRSGLSQIRLLHKRPSRFLGEIYSAISFNGNERQE